jgi:hypothetical protein
MLKTTLRILPCDWYVHYLSVYLSIIPAALRSRLGSTESSLFRGYLHLIIDCHYMKAHTNLEYLLNQWQMSTTAGAVAPPNGVIPNFEHPQDVLYTINLIVEVLCIALVIPFVSSRVYIRAYMMG